MTRLFDESTATPLTVPNVGVKSVAASVVPSIGWVIWSRISLANPSASVS